MNKLQNYLVYESALAGVLLVFILAWTDCGGTGSTTSMQNTPPPSTGPVTTSLTDPPTCGAPTGQFKNVWVTITRVRANISSDAGPDDSGWVDLVDLRSNPKQVDLLSLASTACLLNVLGSTSGLPPGNYQQIRIYLLSNSPDSGAATPSTNNCGSNGFNCVVLSGGTAQTLQLSSEAQTGIKIPPGQIAGGGINLQAGQSADIQIDFSACDSIIRQGNGQYRLKPTLHAGEVALNTNSISGRVVDGSTTPPTPIANAIVLLEQPDPANSNLDRVTRAASTSSDGTFFFCPLPSGDYDVVVSATVVSSLGVTTTYNATVTLKVPLGTALGDIPLVPEPTLAGTTTTPSSPATISGQITTAASGATPTVADISLTALQPLGGGNPLIVTVPVFAGSIFTVETSASPSSGSCPTGTDCENYTLFVPASNPAVGTFSASPPTAYSAPASGSTLYWVNAQAFVPMSASSNPGSPDCTPPSLPAAFDSTTQLTVVAGATTTQNFTFAGCQ